MIAPLVWLGIALAAPPPDLTRAPQRVSAACPEVGLCRLEVPSSFVADNAASWLVMDARGEPVPWAALSDDASPALPRRTRVKMSGDPAAVSLSLPEDCAVEAVEIEFGWGNFQAAARAEVQIAGRDGFVAGPWEPVGAGLIDEDRVALRVPEGPAAALRLVFDRPWTSLPPRLDTRLLCRDASWVAPAEVEMTPGPTGPSAGSLSRYTFSLPERARIVGLQLYPEGDVFRRRVSVATWQASDGELRPVEQSSGLIQRVKVGDLAVDRTRLDGLSLPTDRIALDVDDGADRALSIGRVTATVARRVLLLRDAGPVTLYGGDRELHLSYDLQLAAAELARLPAQDAVLSEIEANPSFSDPLEADALSPGAVMSPERFTFARAVTGQGISRIELPLEVLAHAQSDLRDLRLLDAEGRQIPFIIDWGGVDQLIGGVIVEREQQGQVSRVRLRPPLDTTPVSTLLLRSPDQDFSREVFVYTSSAGRGRALLATAPWSVPPSAESALVMRLDAAVQGGLLVEIDHGDNRVIDVEDPALRGPSAALVARLPAEGATLYYGDRALLRARGGRALKRLRDTDQDPPLLRPSYDAARLAQHMTRAPAARASLGPVIDLAPASPSEADHGFATAGIAVLVVGLLGLVGWLLKGVAAPDEPGQGGTGGQGPAAGPRTS